MTTVRHLTMQELHSGLMRTSPSPAEEGVLDLIVRRPVRGGREVLEEAELDVAHGLVGDRWRARVGSRTSDGSPHSDTQLTLMNSRVIALIAQDRARWPLAGDQLFVDLDLSADNLPPGTRLAIGTAIIEVSAEPHTGCGNFVARYGVDAMKFVNSPDGRRLNLRGIYAHVVRPGAIKVGDLVAKLRDLVHV
jgi:hypothetical protein